MKQDDVEVGGEYLTTVGEALVRVTVIAVVDGAYAGKRTRFRVKRMDNGNVLPKARTAAALSKPAFKKEELDLFASLPPSEKPTALYVYRFLRAVGCPSGEPSKDYWRGYSSVQWENKELFCNTGNGDWALFVDDKFLKEGSESDVPSELKKAYDDLQSTEEDA